MKVQLHSCFFHEKRTWKGVNSICASRNGPSTCRTRRDATDDCINHKRCGSEPNNRHVRFSWKRTTYTYIAEGPPLCKYQGSRFVLLVLYVYINTPVCWIDHSELDCDRKRTYPVSQREISEHYTLNNLRTLQTSLPQHFTCEQVSIAIANVRVLCSSVKSVHRIIVGSQCLCVDLDRERRGCVLV